MAIKIQSQNTPPDHSATVPPTADTVPDNTCNGKCSGCGECCLRMTLRLTNKEINTIRKYIKANNIKPQRHSPNVGPIANPDDAIFVDMICPFLDTSAPNGHNCTIYPVRPIICRSYTCKMYHDPIANKQVFDDTVAACHGEHAAYTLLSSPERNLQQLFFPKEYTPQIYDIVVVNEVYQAGYEQFKGIAFIIANIEKNKKTGVDTACIIYTDEHGQHTTWYPIDGLTVIKKQKGFEYYGV